MRSDADPVAGRHENGSLREQANANGRGSYEDGFESANSAGAGEAANGEMEHAQMHDAVSGESSGQYLEERASRAAPQWFEAGVAQGGVGLGLALWPPTPSLPVDPGNAILPPPPPSRSPTPSSSSSRSTSPVVGEDYATAPIDLVIPALERMPSVSVADGPMGRLAASTSQSQTRSFFANLLNRGSRASWSLSGSNSPSSSPGSSPDLPGGSFGDTSTPHGRSVSMPQLASSPDPRISSDLPRPASRQASRSPRSLAARTFATISRSASMRSVHRSDEVAPPPFDSIPLTASRPSRSVPPIAQPRQSTATESAPPTLSSIGLTLNAITPNLSLSRNAQPLCGAVLDGRYLLIGTTSGLDFLPLPEKGSLPVQHRGLKKRRETRKPLSLIKRTRFKQMVVLNERSNVLVAIAGRNDHVRVYALDGIRAMIERRLAEVDPLQGYSIPPPPPTKGKQRDSSPANVSVPSEDPLSSYQFPPSPSVPERVHTSSVDEQPPNPSERRASTQAPVRLSRRAGSAVGPTVRSLPTAAARAGPSAASSQHGVQNQPRDFIASRRSSTASIPRRPSRPNLGTTSPSLSRRASLQSVNSRRSSTYTLGSRRGSVAPLNSMPSSRLPQSRRDSNLEPRAPLRQLNAAEGSPTSSLAEFLRETGPEMGLPDLDKLIVKPRRHSVDVEGENRSPRAAHFLLDRGVGEMPRLRRFSAAEDANASVESTAGQERNVSRPSGPCSPSLELAEILYGSGPPRRQSQLLARSPLINDQEVVATSRALLETLTEEPPSALPPTTPRARKRWTFNGATPFQLSRSPVAAESQLSPTAPASPPLPPANEPELPAPVAARTEVVNVVPTYARPTERRDSQQQQQRDFKRRSIASMRSLGGPTDKSPRERSAQAHPANVQSPLDYVKLARSRGARVLKAVETRKRTYLAILSGEDGDRIELFTGSKNISLSLNRTFVLPDTPRSIELQLQGDELVDIYLMYAESIFALEPSTVRVREVGVGREERRARRQRERQREEQERQLGDGAPTPPPDLTETAAGSSAAVDRLLFDADSSEAATTAARAPGSPPLYASPSATTASPLRTSVSAGAEHARPTCDYSAFQQLPFIPPVPASVLASAWTIPPLYTDVVSDDASLSPVSLLGGAALRNNGPPGLFFCSKGMDLSGIVTADGKSVIKSPLRWSHVHHRASYEDEDDADALARHRLEILVLADRTTVVVKLTDRHVEALPIVGREESPSAIELLTRARSSVHFLATNMSGEQLFFAEANNSSFTIKCLSGLP